MKSFQQQTGDQFNFLEEEKVNNSCQESNLKSPIIEENYMVTSDDDDDNSNDIFVTCRSENGHEKINDRSVNEKHWNQKVRQTYSTEDMSA